MTSNKRSFSAACWAQPLPGFSAHTTRAPAGRRVHYQRRRPEDTVLYQLVQEHLETFLAQVELETGAGFPEFVKDELMPFSHLPHCHGRGR